MKITPQDGINAKAHRKEKNFTHSLTAINLTPDIEDHKRAVLELRFYRTATRRYCCL